MKKIDIYESKYFEDGYIKTGLTLLEYIEWAKEYEPLQVSRVTSKYIPDSEVSKQEILDYAEWNKKQNKKPSKPYQGYSSLKCKTCKNCYSIDEYTRYYIIRCKEENCIFPHQCDIGSSSPNCCPGYNSI